MVAAYDGIKKAEISYKMLQIFFNIFSLDFARWKSVGLPHITYIVIN